MATKSGTKIEGESFGYVSRTKLTIVAATKLASATITPIDADLHDISKEGILITSLSWRPVWNSNTWNCMLGVFNRTTNVAPVANISAAAYRDNYELLATGAAYLFQNSMIERNLAILPGGGVPLIADFITVSAEILANLGVNLEVLVDIYYKWISINPDDYRKILYARSI
jgi:hypothetical protein